MRALFFFLLLANLALAAWLLLNPEPRPGGLAGAGGNLQLYAESPQPASPSPAPEIAVGARPAPTPAASVRPTPAPEVPAETAANPGAAPPPRVQAAGTPAGACFWIGPLDDEDARRDLAARLRARGVEVREEERTRGVSRYWVFIPPRGGMEAAFDVQRRLQADGVVDLQVIPGGPKKGAVSLGLYRNPAIAREREARIRALGYPVVLEETVQNVTRPGLLVLSQEADGELRSRVEALAGDHGLEPVACPGPPPGD